MSKIVLKNIFKSFDGINMLKDINIDIEEGEFVSLLGPSGCGKSTLLKIIAGLLEVDSGEVFFDDKDFTTIETNERNAIIVFQDYSLFPHLSVYDNIAYGLKMRKMKKTQIKDKVNEMLEIIELKEKMNFLPSELSGGQQQRVAIARALVVKPRILLLDEPFSGLDNNLKDVMKSFVMNITSKFNITTLMVTHDKEEAFSMSDKVAIMLDGQIVQFDVPNNIYNKPMTLDTVKFLSMYNIIDGKIENGVFRCELGEFETTLDNNEFAKLIVNQEDIELTSIPDAFGKIIEKYYSGRYTQYIVSFKSILLKINFEDSSLNIEDVVSVKIKKYNIIS